MNNWRIWYSDGYVDGVTEQDWINAPDDNVQGVGVFFGHDTFGRKLFMTYTSSDWYWMDNGVIVANYESADEVGVWLEHNAPSTAIIKKGRYTTDERIEEVENQMSEWCS